MAERARAIAASDGRRTRSKFNPTENAVQRTRAWTGLLVVVAGDVLIGGAAAFGVFQAGNNAAQSVAILSSAFTAIGTMTAAYFGIRAVTNTAQSAVAQQTATTLATVGAAPAGSAAAGSADGGPGGPGGAGGGTGGPAGPGVAVAVGAGTAVAEAADTAVAGAPDTTMADEPAAAVAADQAQGGADQAQGGADQADREADQAQGEADQPKPDRPVDEPDDATQDEQFGLIRETGNDRQDMSEEDEARILEGEFGPADQRGIYGAPKGDESQ